MKPKLYRLNRLFALAITIPLAACQLSDSVPSAPRYEPFERTVTNLTQGKRWQFAQDNCAEESLQADFDDTGWETVSMPHSIDVENGQTGKGHFKGCNTYRENLEISALDASKRYYLEFDGAAMISRVYINDRFAGEHTGGYTRFRIDVTDFLIVGENQLAVQVDNRLGNPLDPGKAYAQLDTQADFTAFGGIYRDVRLLTVNDVAIDLEDFGGPGIYLSQTEVGINKAKLQLNARLRNKSAADVSANVRVYINDADGNTVWSMEYPSQAVDADAAIELKDSITLKNITLWQGMDNPYLYSVHTQVVDTNGHIVDEVAQPLGLRRFAFDPQQGFVLNGKSYPLRGVNMHQDQWNKGWASSREDRARDLDIIREIGANTIRLAHYPHNLDVTAMSDRHGFLNWHEIPLINNVAFNSRVYINSAKQQVEEMIKQNYNHPSVAVWGIHNEITNKMNTADPEELQTAADILNEINAHAQALDGDAYRRTVSAIVELDIEDPVEDTTEIVAFNRYQGWYHATLKDMGKKQDEYHDAHPNRAIGLSEYGADMKLAAKYQVDIPINQDYSEQFGQKFHESYLKQINQRPYIWGTHLWNMFDFSSVKRSSEGRNYKGLVNIERDVYKDVFFLYQASWSDEPVLHLTNKRREKTTLNTIKVYSNCDKVTLTIDGKAVDSKRRSDNDPDLSVVFNWADLKLTVGPHSVVVTGTKDGREVTDSFTFERVASDVNTLTSDVVAIHSSRSNGTNVIGQIPEAVTLSDLLSLTHSIPNASYALLDTGSSVLANDTLIDEGKHRLRVTSESGKERLYSFVQPDSLSMLRPISDSFSEMIANGVVNAVPQIADAVAINQLVDGNDNNLYANFTTGFQKFAPTEVSIRLQGYYYIDEIEVVDNSAGMATQVPLFTLPLMRGNKIGWADGALDFDLSLNNVLIDNKVYQSVRGFDATANRRQSFPIQNYGSNVKIEFIGATKTISGLSRAAFPAVSLSEIRVFGGMIASDNAVVDLDYRARHFTVTDGNKTLADLMASLRKAENNNIEVTVKAYGVDNKVLAGGSSVSDVAVIEASRIVSGYTFKELYTRQ